MDTKIYIMLLTIKKSESLKFMFTLWVKYFPTLISLYQKYVVNFIYKLI